MPGNLNRYQQLWKNNFEELKRFREKNDHFSVPPDYTTEDGYKLLVWIGNQRANYKKGDMLQERIDALNAIDFSWYHNEDHWQEQFQLLEQYKEEHGHCVVPVHHGTLGSWVSWQRVHYHKDELAEERIQKLDSIGFLWNASHIKCGRKVNDAQWQEKFDLLKQYKKKNGDCLVPGKHKALGFWVVNQRQYYKKGKLFDYRFQQLDSIGFVWDASFDKRKNSRNNLKASTAEHSASPTRSQLNHNSTLSNSSDTQSTPASVNKRKHNRAASKESRPSPKKRPKTAPDDDCDADKDKIEIERLQVLLASRDETISEQKIELGLKDKIIKDQKKDINVKDMIIVDHKEEILSLEMALAKQKKDLDLKKNTKDAIIKEQKKENENMAEIIWRQKKEIHGKNEKILEQMEEIQCKDKIIEKQKEDADLERQDQSQQRQQQGLLGNLGQKFKSWLPDGNCD